MELFGLPAGRHDGGIRHPLVACLDLGILLNHLDFQLRFAWLAHDQEALCNATRIWEELGTAVRETDTSLDQQRELLELLKSYEHDCENSYFTEQHAEDRWRCQRDYSQQMQWNAPPLAVCRGEACEELSRTRPRVLPLLESFSQRLTKQQFTFVELGRLLDRGKRSDELPEEIFLPLNSTEGDPDEYFVPLRTPAESPPRDIERWRRELQHFVRVVQRSFEWSAPEAFDIDFTAANSADACAHFIIKAIVQAVGGGGGSSDGQLVTLGEVARMVKRTKSALRKHKNKPGFPKPVQAGNRGEKLFGWDEMRIYLEKAYERRLPETFPHNTRDGAQKK